MKPIFFLILISLFLVSCAFKDRKTVQGLCSQLKTPSREVRNNACSLLNKLLSDQKNLYLLSYIKQESPEAKTFMMNVSSSSAKGGKLLEGFSKRDSSFLLVKTDLPLGELKTRASIASAKEKDLLSLSDAPFEIALLTTQASALEYASHLAKVAAENDFDPERIKKLNQLSKEMKILYREAISLLYLNPIPKNSLK